MFRELLKADRKILSDLKSKSIQRLPGLSLILAFSYSVYGLVSLPFINKFSHSIGWNVVTPLENIGPRIFLNTLPFLGLYWLTKHSRIREPGKFLLWAAGFPLITVIASCIYVWPLALEGAPVIPMAHAANNVLIIIVATVVAPPIKDLGFLIGFYVLLFITPLLIVCSLNGDRDFFFTVLNDSVFYLTVAFILGVYIHSLHFRMLVNSGRHLNRRVVRNLQLNNKIPRAVERGFVLSFDIRGFTELMKSIQGLSDGEILKHPVINYYSEFRKSMSFLASKYGAILHKTTGDGAIGLWGILDDIQELESAGESDKSLFNLYFNLFDNSVSFFRDLVSEISNLSGEHGISVVLGAGLTYGKCIVEEFGENIRELDIIGVPVVEAVRMETFSKYFINLRGTAHYLVVSPECEPFISESKYSFEKFETTKSPAIVRDFSERTSVYIQMFSVRKSESHEDTG